MNGFREFSQQKAPIDPKLLELVVLARVHLEEAWEEEFLESVSKRIEQGWGLSAKQLDVLEKLSTGFYAEMRQRQHDSDGEGLRSIADVEHYSGKSFGDR